MTMGEAKGIVIDIHDCSRCGGAHKDLYLHPLDEPLRGLNGEIYTHQTFCPDRREGGIMMICLIEDKTRYGVTGADSGDAIDTAADAG